MTSPCKMSGCFQRASLKLICLLFILEIGYILRCKLNQRNWQNVLQETARYIDNTSHRMTPHEVAHVENGLEDQYSPLLIKRLRTGWIHSPLKGPLTLDNPNRVYYSQYGQDAMVDELLGQKTNGFYVECGALDGEYLSNSLFFERHRNWTGLLIEPSVEQFERLLSKTRNAYTLNACLNTENKTGSYRFNIVDRGLDGLFSEMNAQARAIGIQKAQRRKRSQGNRKSDYVQCFTLHSIMKAIGRRRIDFFSLDVEGAEYSVLKTIPFQYLDIDVVLLEYVSLWEDVSSSFIRHIGVHNLMKANGYRLVKKTNVDLLYRKIPRVT